MKNNNKPSVAIIGGFWELKKQDPVMFENAKKIAREIGIALAKEKMGLVVYYSDDESLEPYVVSGYVSAVPNGTCAGSIRVRFAESQRNKVRFTEQSTREDLFERHLFPGNEWEAPFYRSLVDANEVDAVLLMAGARSTLIAGQIALARSLPVLAIDHFGGSAGVIRTELATASKNYPSLTTHSVTELVAWLKQECITHGKRKEVSIELEREYLKITSRVNKSYWAGSAFFVLLITLFFGLVQVPIPRIYPFLMFCGLIAAGATGALARSVLWTSKENSPVTSLILGGIAGFIVGLAYIIPQWVGAPGVLELNQDTVKATDKIQFVSAVLVALSAGVGFDTIFTRIKKEAEEHHVLPSVLK